MSNSYFQFQQFTIHQDRCAMKVSTEACILGAWARFENPGRILDIGTGTGLLSLMLAQRYSCLIDGVEIDHEAAGQAKENVSSSPWSDRLQIHHADILEFQRSISHQYDLIVCNPPFFKDHQKSNTTRKNLALHESEAFDKKKLLSVLQALLAEVGHAFVLYPEVEAMDLEHQLGNFDLKCSKKLIIRNQPEGSVFRVIMQIDRFAAQTKNELMSIRIGDDYSRKMKLLLRDYYLALRER